MYDENSMKSHIFWLKFRRVFLLLALTIIGTAIGVVISDYIVNILLFHSNFRIIIVSISASIFLAIALLLTANTGKDIEDGYWKIAVYKKLAIISKKLDNLENNDSNKNFSKHDKVSNTSPIKENKNISEEHPSNEALDIQSKLQNNSENTNNISNNSISTNSETLDELTQITNELKEDISQEIIEKNNNLENK